MPLIPNSSQRAHLSQVRLEWATTSKAKLEALGVTKYELRQYADLGHGANQQEIADVEAWLHQRLPPL